MDPKNFKIQIGLMENFSGSIVRLACSKKIFLEIKHPELKEIITCNDHEILISPMKIADFIHSKGITPVFVKSWAIQIFFSSFDLQKDILTEQLWSFKNNDVILYSQLVADHKIIFQGTHDIVGHITGLNREGFSFAAEVGRNIFKKLHMHFGKYKKGNLPSHLIPFLIGLLLDDLAQKPYYFSTIRAQAIEELLKCIDDFKIDPYAPLILRKFPEQLSKIHQLIRNETAFSIELIRSEIKKLYEACSQLIEPYALGHW